MSGERRPGARAAPSDWVWGAHAVEEQIRYAANSVVRMDFSPAGGRTDRGRALVDSARKAGVIAVEVDLASLDRRFAGQAHQGFAAQIRPFEFTPLDQLLARPGNSLLVALDEVQDPHNVGAIARSALAFGATGMIVCRHRGATIGPGAAKAAAGALARLPVAQATNLVQALQAAKEIGFWVFGADTAGAVPLHRVKWAERSVVVLGSEADGLRRSVRDACDMAATIETDGVESLNVSVAGAILCHDWKQKIRTLQNGA